MVAGNVLLSPPQAPLSHSLSSPPKSHCCFLGFSCLSSSSRHLLCLPEASRILAGIAKPQMWSLVLQTPVTPLSTHPSGRVEFKDISLKGEGGASVPAQLTRRVTASWLPWLTFPPHPWWVRPLLWQLYDLVPTLAQVSKQINSGQMYASRLGSELSCWEHKEKQFP